MFCYSTKNFIHSLSSLVIIALGRQWNDHNIWTSDLSFTGEWKTTKDERWLDLELGPTFKYKYLFINKLHVIWRVSSMRTRLYKTKTKIAISLFLQTQVKKRQQLSLTFILLDPIPEVAREPEVYYINGTVWLVPSHSECWFYPAKLSI